MFIDIPLLVNGFAAFIYGGSVEARRVGVRD
jgi:hypothetical protein